MHMPVSLFPLSSLKGGNQQGGVGLKDAGLVKFELLMFDHL